jgi:DNA-binding response OmpR family regulator
MKILILEDEENLRLTIISFLEEEGYYCEQASTLETIEETISF